MSIDFTQLWPGLLAGLFIGFQLGRASLASGGNEQKLSRLNRKLDKLLNHFQLQPQEAGLLEACRTLKANQGMIAAIKYYRDQTGVSLKEAKDEMDAI